MTLIAVSKTRPVEDIVNALDAGQRVFGESRIQELRKKQEALAGDPRADEIEWHFIGPLQSNKAKQIVRSGALVQSVGAVRHANALQKSAEALGRMISITLQVNTGREPQKSGVLPETFATFLNEVQTLPNLQVRGVMAIPPAGDDPREHFGLLRTIADEHELAVCSMGMSGDYVEAIRCGATHVRVGSAIFGSRS